MKKNEKVEKLLKNYMINYFYLRDKKCYSHKIFKTRTKSWISFEKSL